MATKFKLSQPQQERLRRLLHMEYTVTELAEEIGCARRVIQRAVAEACPHRREHNRVYVVGDCFASWYGATCAQDEAVKVALGDDEAYCLRCRAARKMVDEVIEANSPGVVLVRGRCAVCGARVNRFRKGVQA